MDFSDGTGILMKPCISRSFVNGSMKAVTFSISVGLIRIFVRKVRQAVKSHGRCYVLLIDRPWWWDITHAVYLNNVCLLMI